MANSNGGKGRSGGGGKPVSKGMSDAIEKMSTSDRRVLRTALRGLLNLKEVHSASSNTDNDAGFRRLTARSDKEIAPAKWQKQMSVAHFLWQQNPMAFRILELMADFVVGDGFTWKAEDEELSKIIKRHWDDPDNAWEISQFDRYLELILFGTFLLRPFVNPHNGHVKVSPVDPAWIEDIIPHPNIAGRASALKIKRRSESVEGKTETWKVVETANTDPKNPDAQGLLKGDVFYFTVNKLTFLNFGMSDLYRLADWLDAFDQFVFSLMERINFLNAHLYDITIEGAEQPEIDERATALEMKPPRPGSFRIHNEKEKWEALAPKINAAEVEAVAKIIKMLILGSMGIPEAWYSDGGDTNRSTIEGQAPPILRKMKRKQAQWVQVLTTVIQFQIDQAVLAKRLTPTQAAAGFQIIPPDLSSKDVLQFVDALEKLTSTLASAITEGFIKREQAAEVWHAQAAEVGVEIKAPKPGEADAQFAAEQAGATARAQDAASEPYAAVPPAETPKAPPTPRASTLTKASVRATARAAVSANGGAEPA